MAQYRFYHKIRVAVPTEAGITQVYVAPEEATTVEQSLLAGATRRGARRHVDRRSPKGDGTSVASTAALLRQDGSPAGIMVTRLADRTSLMIVVRTGQRSADQRWVRSIDHFRTPRHAFQEAVRVLAGRLQLDGKQIATLSKAWPDFARRYGL